MDGSCIFKRWALTHLGGFFLNNLSSAPFATTPLQQAKITHGWSSWFLLNFPTSATPTVTLNSTSIRIFRCLQMQYRSSSLFMLLINALVSLTGSIRSQTMTIKNCSQSWLPTCQSSTSSSSSFSTVHCTTNSFRIFRVVSELWCETQTHLVPRLNASSLPL